MKIGLAMTWDGARWPMRSLPAQAREFLTGKDLVAPSRQATVKLLADDQVGEIRICWVPNLKGGDDVLSEPFLTADGKRIAFRSIRTVRMGDVLGVVYRKKR